jgi:hypothetical protein
MVGAGSTCGFFIHFAILFLSGIIVFGVIGCVDGIGVEISI